MKLAVGSRIISVQYPCLKFLVLHTKLFYVVLLQISVGATEWQLAPVFLWVLPITVFIFITFQSLLMPLLAATTFFFRKKKKKAHKHPAPETL